MTDDILRGDNEWRKDLVDNAYTLVARNRRVRPPLTPRRTLDDTDGCPYCAGDAGRVLDREGDVVCVPCPTPLAFVEADFDSAVQTQPALQPTAALGAHELLLPARGCAHGGGVRGLDRGTLRAVFALVERRSADLHKDFRLRTLSVLIAAPSEARLGHPHAALIVTPFRTLRGQDPCPVCVDVDDARAHGRVWFEDGPVVVYAPFAPRGPGHIRVAAPHHPNGDVDVAAALGRAVARAADGLAAAFDDAEVEVSIGPLPLLPDVHPVVDVRVAFDVDAALSRALGARVTALSPEALMGLLGDRGGV